MTTGDVAGFLESKYHVMEIFFREHEEDVARDLEGSVEGAIESLLTGAPPSLDPFGSAASSIEDRMKQFVVTAEMDRLGYPGVPTQAARDRASGKTRGARFKRKRATNAGPVSFVDSGLFVASMKAWIT